MTETVVLGKKTYELTPMSLVEAVEVMFIARPYAKILSAKTDFLEILTNLITSILEHDPADAFRFLAYMLHVDADELIDESVGGDEVSIALASCFNTNSITDLLDVAHLLGIIDMGESDE